MLGVSTIDIAKLTSDTGGASRVDVANKIAADFAAERFSKGESDVAIEIFRLLLKDAQKQVRMAMAEHLSLCSKVPHDIIVTLANDDVEIALPVLEHSSVLTDADLLEIIKSTKEIIKLVAVARREGLSETVSDGLIALEQDEVLTTLFMNKSANLGPSGLEKSWQYISSRRSLIETLVHRGNLPLTIAEKIYYVVSDEMRDILSKQYRIKLPTAQKASSDAREWQMLGIIPSQGTISADDDEDVEDLVDQLYYGGRLTHSFLMRSLCIGSLSIFEAGIARLAGVPRVNARILLMDSGSMGFQAIYEAAAMPPGFADAVGLLLRIALEETDFGVQKHTDFRKRVIDRIYKEGHHKTVDNMQYLLAIIGGKIVPTTA